MDEINDTRQPKDFQYTTFGNFKRSDVKKELNKSLQGSKIETACYWCAEMICSGYLEDLWDLLILFYSKFIHLGNVKLLLLLSKRLDYFKRIVLNLDSEFNVRNHSTCRVLFAELICVLCLSKKRNCLNPIEIRKETFDIIEMKQILKATNMEFAKESFKKDEDSNDLMVPVNEFCYSLNVKDTLQCFYWIEWLLEYENRCLKKKETIKIARRSEFCTTEKFQKDMAWLLWECISKELEKVEKNKPFLVEIFKGTINLFQSNYNTVRGKKKKFLLFFFSSILTEPFDISSNIIESTHHDIIENVKDNINSVYKQIKKNEVFKHVEYLQIQPSNFLEKEKGNKEKDNKEKDIINDYYRISSIL